MVLIHEPLEGNWALSAIHHTQPHIQSNTLTHCKLLSHSTNSTYKSTNHYPTVSTLFAQLYSLQNQYHSTTRQPKPQSTRKLMRPRYPEQQKQHSSSDWGIAQYKFGDVQYTLLTALHTWELLKPTRSQQLHYKHRNLIPLHHVRYNVSSEPMWQHILWGFSILIVLTSIAIVNHLRQFKCGIVTSSLNAALCLNVSRRWCEDAGGRLPMQWWHRFLHYNIFNAYQHTLPIDWPLFLQVKPSESEEFPPLPILT
jgi:hypothetical protein